MKHSLKITFLLLSMFFAAQLIGIYVSSVYSPIKIEQYNNFTGAYENKTTYNIPYGFAPPENVSPTYSVTSIVIALIFAVVLMFTLMKFKAEIILRVWFFVVVILGIALALNAFLFGWEYAAFVALVLSIPLAYLKVFKRNLIAHNATELIIYPGISSVFIPLLSIPSVVVLLIIISIYDIYAVWHAGFMQKMARYQIEKIRVFTGFFIPYVDKKYRKLMDDKKKGKKVPVNVAILGGGDVVFPIIVGGVVLHVFGVWSSLIIALGATAALGLLFYYSEKGKFYPAMPFISAGCFLALGLVYLIN